MDRDRALWMRDLRGRIPKAFDALVAAFLATYGDKDGSNNHPGVARLVHDTNLSESTVKRSLAWLAENGWLRLVSKGNRRLKQADTYQLSLPAPVAAELGLWSEATQWVERPTDEPTRPGMRTRPEPARKNQQRVRRPAPPAADIAVPHDPIRGLQQRSEVYRDSPEVQVETYHQDMNTRTSITTPRSLARVRPDGRTRAPSLASIDPHDPDAAEKIADLVAEALGYPPHLGIDPDTHRKIDGMLSSGCHPKLVFNAARHHEQNGLSA
jgi:hypothetical protein